MTKLSKDIPDCTIFLLAKAYQNAHGQFKAQLRPYKLTNLQHTVLEGLWIKEGVTAADLGKLLILDKATLSGVIDRLIESGWVRRENDPDDGRVYKLFTTKKASKVKNALIALRVEANEKLLESFSTEEQILFKRLLKELI